MPHPVVRRLVVGFAAAVFIVPLVVFGCVVIWVAAHVNSRMPVFGPFTVAELVAGRQFTPDVVLGPGGEADVGSPRVPNAILLPVVITGRPAARDAQDLTTSRPRRESRRSRAPALLPRPLGRPGRRGR